MKFWLAIFVTIVPAVSGAQPVLDFRNDLAFRATTINSFAEHIYHERIRKLRTEGKLDQDQALFKRMRSLVDHVRLSTEYERPAATMLSWEVYSCRNCNKNASAMAGGKLLVGEEFIAEIDPTDDELTYCWRMKWGMYSPNTPVDSEHRHARSSARVSSVTILIFSMKPLKASACNCAWRLCTSNRKRKRTISGLFSVRARNSNHLPC